MTNFLEFTVSGVALGAVYALVALGFSVIYRGSQVFNFAQGEFLTWGAFGMIALLEAGLPWGLALLGTMIGTGLLGGLVERSVLRPLVGRPIFVTIIVTIFIGAILHAMAHVVWGSDPMGMPTPWDAMKALKLGGVSIWWNSLAAIIGAALALGGFFLMIAFTRFGVAMRATASDQETALAMGIPVGRVLGATWFLSASYAALGGVLLSMFPRQADMGLSYVALRAFPAVIVGGLESVGGTILAGFLLGIVEVYAQGYVNPLLGNFGQNFHGVFPYIVMIAFLIFRPYGLFGLKEVERL